jgi:hypothetical protein
VDRHDDDGQRDFPLADTASRHRGGIIILAQHHLTIVAQGCCLARR